METLRNCAWMATMFLLVFCFTASIRSQEGLVPVNLGCFLGDEEMKAAVEKLVMRPVRFLHRNVLEWDYRPLKDNAKFVWHLRFQIDTCQADGTQYDYRSTEQYLVYKPADPRK